MDDYTFDRLARALAQLGGRRAALKYAGLAILGGLLRSSPTWAASASPQGQGVSTPNLNGVWLTGGGHELLIKQSASSLVGIFPDRLSCAPGGVNYGCHLDGYPMVTVAVRGTLSGNRLTGQLAICTVNEAGKNVPAHLPMVPLEMTVSQDGKTLDGTWIDPENGRKQPWSLKLRTVEVPPVPMEAPTPVALQFGQTWEQCEKTARYGELCGTWTRLGDGTSWSATRTNGLASNCLTMYASGTTVTIYRTFSDSAAVYTGTLSDDGTHVSGTVRFPFGEGTWTASIKGSPAPVSGTPGTYLQGTVIKLQGTQHLWVADEQGVLHWSGDSRALTSQVVDWSNHQEVTIDELRAQRRGDPWLSTSLLKDGDPIYLAKWETGDSKPQLLHVQSMNDLELFGLNAGNFDTLVLDKSQWEGRYGIAVATLARAELERAVTNAVTSAYELAGSWNSPQLRVLDLKQEADRISGTYARDDGQVNGTINETTIRFRWWEGTKGQPYERAEPSRRGDGFFFVSLDGKKLAGGRRVEQANFWTEHWDATRR